MRACLLLALACQNPDEPTTDPEPVCTPVATFVQPAPPERDLFVVLDASVPDEVARRFVTEPMWESSADTRVYIATTDPDAPQPLETDDRAWLDNRTPQPACDELLAVRTGHRAGSSRDVTRRLLDQDDLGRTGADRHVALLRHDDEGGGPLDVEAVVSVFVPAGPSCELSEPANSHLALATGVTGDPCGPGVDAAVVDLAELLTGDFVYPRTYTLPAVDDPSRLRVTLVDGDFRYEGVFDEALERADGDWSLVCDSVCFVYQVVGRTLVFDGFVPGPGSRIEVCALQR
jgi:hypothetical protein